MSLISLIDIIKQDRENLCMPFLSYQIVFLVKKDLEERQGWQSYYSNNNYINN